MRALAGATIILALLVSGPAWAGGLYLNEFGTPTMGTASAGANALCESAAVSFHNPACMTRFENPELMLTGGLLSVSAEFDPDPNTPVAGNDGGDAGGPAPLIGLFWVKPLNDKWAFGINSISVAAAVLDYDDGWAGRYQVEEVSIFTLSLMPSVGYKVNDKFSLGAGLNLLYGIMNMELAFPTPTPGPGEGSVELDGLNDFGVGLQLSALFEPRDGSRIGLFWASELEVDVGGDANIALPGPPGERPSIAVEATVPFAQVAGISTYNDLNDRWALVTQFRWEDWSTFDNLFISIADRGEAAIPRKWEDVYHAALGFRYRSSDRWLYKAGWAYDTSPTTAANRTADLPIDRQWRLAAGAEWDKSEKLDIGFEFTYADFGSAKIDSDTLIGEFSTNRILMFGVSFNWTRGL
jgi:long-chain fatty acid transport protein